MRTKHKRWYRRPRTTAEKRANQDHEYVRGRRRPCNLPNSWDDMSATHTRNWKDHRKTQYHAGGRGAKHQIIVDQTDRWGGQAWRLEEYFKDHDIPFRIRRLYDVEIVEKHGYWTWETDWLRGQWETRRRILPRDPNGPMKQETRYETYNYWVPNRVKVWKEYKEPRTVRYHHHKGIEVTWWSDKDIGIDYILARTEHW